MMDEDLGPSPSEAGSSLAVPPMSKAERLHRWADSLELQKQLQGTPIDDDGWCATPAESSPLTVAFEDWAFQAEGLRSEPEDALAFFDLSEVEMRRIVSRSDDGRRTLPAAVAAERVRALAERTESTTVPLVGVVITGASVGAVLGWVLVAS
jgi:hypothetical protein